MHRAPHRSRLTQAARTRKANFEVLEHRWVLATVTVGDLTLSGDFQNGVATGQVLIGFEVSTPLVAINDGRVTADTAGGTFSVVPAEAGTPFSISLSALASPITFWESGSSDPVLFNASTLVTSGHSFSSDGGTSEGITVADLAGGFYADHLALLDGTDGAADLVNLQGYLDFGVVDLDGLHVDVDQANFVQLDSDTQTLTLTGVDAMSDDDFTLAGVTFEGDFTVAYAGSTTNQFTFGGPVEVGAMGLEGATSGSDVQAGLDMVVEQGQLQTVALDTSGSFQVWDLEVVPDDLGFEYAVSDEQFVMYGDARLVVPNGVASDSGGTTSLTAQLGSASSPGLVIDNTGTVTQVDVSVYGTFNMLGFKLESPESNPATFQYKAAEALYELSGKVTAPEFWNASVTMGTTAQPGIMIKDGNWSVDNLDVAFSDVELGAFEIQKFKARFSQPSATELDFDFDLDIVFPQDWSVDADIKTSFNEQTRQFEIDDVFMKASGLEIAIGDTGLFLTEIDASIQNIDQPSDLIVAGDVTVEYGEAVKIFDHQVKLFQAKGGFLVDKDELKIDAKVWLGAISNENGSTTGVLGEGSGAVVLDWNDRDYSLDVKASLLDGVFDFEGAFDFYGATNTRPLEIIISAEVDLEVPHGIPLIGGDKLGSADFLFKYIAPDAENGQAEGFIAAWTRVDLIVSHVEFGIEYDFTSDKVKTIGAHDIKALKRGAEKPKQKTYVYSQPFTNSSGATQGTLSVDWSRTFAKEPESAVISVVLPDGTKVSQSDFATNGLSLLTTSAGGELGSEMQSHVGMVNPQADTQSHTGNLAADSKLVTITGSMITPAINGWAVSGAGIAPGATATYVNASTIKLSDAPMASASGVPITFTNPYVALADATGQDFTSYTLQVEFKSESAPIDETSKIHSITEDIDSGDILITFENGAPSTLQVGDTVSIAGSSVASYNVSDEHKVTAITANGAIVDLPYAGDTTDGKLSGWTLPQFNATYHLPRPTVLVDSPSLDVTSSELTVTMPVQVDNALASTTNVDLYIDTFDASLGANQRFKGVLLSKDIALGTSTEVNGQLQYTASTTVDLSQPGLDLLPIEYYLYAVVNDGTNTPVTSTLTSNGNDGFNDVFENVFALSGTVANQSHQDLSGWTVFVDTNGNNRLDAEEPSYVTSSDGFFGFYANQLPTNTPFNVVVQMLDSTVYTFDAPTLSIPAAGFSIVEDGLELATQATWDGTNPVSVDFEVAQFSVIEGVVTNTTSHTPLSGWTVFLDTNGNGQLDPGEGSTQTNSSGVYELTNLLAASITSITSSSSTSSPTAVLNLAGAVPSTLKVGDTITVSGTSDGAYNTTHTITAINAASIFTDRAFTTTATGGLVVGPDVSETVALAIWNGSAATYSFGLDQVQGTLVLDSSGSPKTQQHVGALEGGAAVGSASSFGVADHPNAGTDNQILKLDQSGGSQYISVNSSSDLSPGLGAFSAAGWVRPNASGAILEGIAGAIDSTGGWAMQIRRIVDFASPQTFTSGFDPASIAASDFNGDGKPDLAIANSSGKLSIMLNTTTPGAAMVTFAAPQQFDAGNTPTSVVVEDFNKDGKPDVAVSNFDDSSVSILLNMTPDGATTASFAMQQIFATGMNPNAIAVGDFNNDGKPDLASANQNSNDVSVLLNRTADGSAMADFAAPVSFAAGVMPSYVAGGDVNNDGKPDLIVANNGSGDISVLINTSDAGGATTSFAAQQTFTVGQGPSSIAVGDINGDGTPDLAVANSKSSNVSVLLNNTTDHAAMADFAAPQNQALGQSPFDVAIGDLNGDGVNDLAVTEFNGGHVAVLVNTTSNGATTVDFDSPQTYPTAALPTSIAIEDFNGDTQPDMAVGSFITSDNLSILMNESGSQPIVELAENGGGGSLTLQAPTALDNGQWHHVAFTYDPNADDDGNGMGVGTVKLYVDGVLTASSANRGSLSASADISDSAGVTFNVGAQGGGSSPLNGYLDDLSIWDQAISAAQVLALYNGATTPSYSQAAPTDPNTYDVSLSGAFDLKQGNSYDVTESSSLAGSVLALPLQDEHLAAVAVPAQGWTINLLDDQSQVVTSTTSNAMGQYQFAGLASGTYAVELLLPAGWRRVTDLASEIVLDDGQHIDELNFVAAQLGQVNGSVFDDVNGNGQRDAGEPPLGAAIAYIDFNHNGQLDSGSEPATTTSDYGAYAFAGLEDGTYQLRLAPLSGRLLTGPDTTLHEFTILSGEVTSDAAFDFLTIANTPPVVDHLVTAPTAEGQPFRIQASWSDPETDAASTMVTIHWGDGTASTQTVAWVDGQGSIIAEHVYADGGFYNATLVLTDGLDAAVESTTSFTAIITGVGIHDGVLQVVGTDGDDRVSVVQNGPHGFLVVASFLPRATKRLSTSTVETVEVETFSGNDTVRVSGSYDTPTTVNGVPTDCSPGSLRPIYQPQPRQASSGGQPSAVVRSSIRGTTSMRAQSVLAPQFGASEGHQRSELPRLTPSLRGNLTERSVDALFEQLGAPDDATDVVLERQAFRPRTRIELSGVRRR